MAGNGESKRIDPFGGLAWQQVADDITADIESGKIAPGAKLPSEQQLAGIYGCARVTIRRALAALRERGLIITAHGRGTFVKPPGRSAPPQL